MVAEPSTLSNATGKPSSLQTLRVQVVFTQGGVWRPGEKVVIQVVYKQVQSVVVLKNPF